MNQNIKQLADILKDSKNIVFFGGAGVSTSSGVPDFRSSTGLYSKPQLHTGTGCVAQLLCAASGRIFRLL